MVNIREYYDDMETGERKPGRKGKYMGGVRAPPGSRTTMTKGNKEQNVVGHCSFFHACRDISDTGPVGETEASHT